MTRGRLRGIFGRSKKYEVTVAAFGDPSKPMHEGLSQAEWEKPYRDRPKITMAVERSESLASVLSAAYREFGVPPSALGGETTEGPDSDPYIPYVAFYRAQDEERFSSTFELAVPVLDELGRVIFREQDFDQITIGQLLDAAEATALDGDPLRPYLILAVPQGGEAFVTWALLANFWDLAWYALEHLAVAGGAYAAGREIVERLRSRIKNGRDVVAVRGEQWWMEQNALPPDVAAFLGKVPRTTEQVAGLLGCSENEAAAALWAFGLARDPESGLWYPGGDEEAKLLGGNVSLIIDEFNRVDLNELFKQRAERLLETGEAPDIEWRVGEENGGEDGEG